MVDASLPYGTLRYLYLDLNSYFASVEQQERPELRGRPVAVVPVQADTSFCIAVSTEAKKRGVKTLMQIGEAKRICPDLACVQARPNVYVAYHNQVIETVETVLPVEKVCSIDEMRIRLLGEERIRPNAEALAREIKAALREHLGECIRASIGLAPNAFLAKVGTDMMKPDGLVVLETKDLPHKLFDLKITDFAGINKRMAIRLNAAGIFTTQQMCEATRDDLIRAFGSVLGEKWWFLLRGHDIKLDTDARKSLGHSHVLPPDLRTDEGCRLVLLRLIQKASARLRASELWAKSMTLTVKGFTKTWEAKIKLPPTHDTLKLNDALFEAWPTRDYLRPRAVAVTFHDLCEREAVTPSLFDEVVEEREQLNQAVDEINNKYGKNTIFLAGLSKAKDTAKEKIAFNKTWLFSEGKGDHEWVDTFRGHRITPQQDQPEEPADEPSE